MNPATRTTTTPDSSPKLAQKTAERIERDIIRLGWPVGRSFGSEAELVARYGVGRWVMREAINIVAADGLLELRRGRSGGLFVAAPAEGAVITMLQNYLELSQAGIGEIIAARMATESLAMRLAADRIDLARADELLRFASTPAQADGDEGLLLNEIFAVTGNLALYVFGCALANTMRVLLHEQRRDEKKEQRYRRMFSEWRGAQINAIVAADTDAALAIQQQCLECWEAQARSLSRRKTMRAVSVNGSAKAADLLIAQLLDEIAAHDWREGANLGGEAELLARFGVSRETLREAIRRLERHGIVQMRLGRGAAGGLRIANADPAATIKSAALYLSYTKLPTEAVYEMQLALEVAAISSLVSLPQLRRDAISVELGQLAAVAPAATLSMLEAHLYDYYLHLSDRCGNPVLALFIRILASLITIESTDDNVSVSPDVIASVQIATQRLAAAIATPDVVIARRCFLEIRRISTRLKPHERSAEDIVASEFHEKGSGGNAARRSRKNNPKI